MTPFDLLTLFWHFHVVNLAVYVNDSGITMEIPKKGPDVTGIEWLGEFTI